MSEGSTPAAANGDTTPGRGLAPLTPAQQRSALAGFVAAAAALGAVVVSGDRLGDGDLPISVDNTIIGGLRLTGLHGALDRLIDQIEREIGQPIEQLDREGKQAVVHRLDELGAFNLRKAVEDIADRLHVSRFTVYNYLNSQS